MTRFVVDAAAVLRLADEEAQIPGEHQLLAPTLLRRRAWELADRLGWASTYDAEYVALTQLQADAFVTLDQQPARRLEGVVTTASLDELR
jgi:hypothetical protein